MVSSYTSYLYFLLLDEVESQMACAETNHCVLVYPCRDVYLFKSPSPLEEVHYLELLLVLFEKYGEMFDSESIFSCADNEVSAW